MWFDKYFKLFNDIYSKIMRMIELRRYDDFNIEEYFRKQGAKVGKNNRLQIRSLGEMPFLVTIGNHCTIVNDVGLLTHDGSGWLFVNECPSLQRFGKITILDNCFIGFRSTILPNITIGPNSIVGACSVVTKNVPPNTIVAGNPARIICSIDNFKEKIVKEWEQQRPDGYLTDLKNNTVYTSKEITQAKVRDMNILCEHLRKYFQIS